MTDDLRKAIERLVNNVAVANGISRDRAIFAIESVLQDLKRQPPTPPEPPVVRKAA